MTIAVDFDGTIVSHAYPRIGDELPFAIDTLKQLAADGHKIILWSVREGKHLDEAVEFCRSKGLEFYAVNCEFPGLAWNGSGSRKVKADLYIDDRNLGGIPDWSLIYKMISGHMSFSDLIEAEVRDELESGNRGTFYNATFAHGTAEPKKNKKSKKKHHHHTWSKNPIVRFFDGIVERCRSSRIRYMR